MDKTVIKKKEYTKRQLLPGAMPFVVGAILYATATVTAFSTSYRLPILLTAFLGIVVLTTLFSRIAAESQSRIESWRLVMAPILLVSGAFLFHLLVGSPSARFIIVTFVMLLLSGHVMRVDAICDGGEAELDKALRYNRLVSLTGFFALAIFGFGIRQFLYVPMALTAVVLGALFAVIAYEAFYQAEEADPRFRVMASAVLGLLAAELFIGLSFLPTPFMANAVVLLVGGFASIRASLRILQGDLGTRELRWGVAMAILMMVAVLATARWN